MIAKRAGDSDQYDPAPDRRRQTMLVLSESTPVRLGILVAVAACVSGVVWWAAVVEGNQRHQNRLLEELTTEIKIVHTKLGESTTLQTELKFSLADVQRRVERVEKRIP